MARSFNLLRLLSVLLCFAVVLPLCSSVSVFARTGEAETIVVTRTMTEKEALEYAVRSYRYSDDIDWSLSYRYADQLSTEDQQFFYGSFLSVTPSTGQIEHKSDSFDPIPVSSYKDDPDYWKAQILAYAADQIVPAYAAFCFDNPHLSFWSGSIRYGISLKSSSVAGISYYNLTISAEVKMSDEFVNEDISTMTANLSEKLQDLSNLTVITPTTQSPVSRYDILKELHDNLCNSLVYNLKGTYAHSAYSVVTGQAVCEGYAKGMKMLCDRYQIPCMIVTGTGVTSKGREGHAWNVIRMENGKWYGLDATWDDQSTIYYDFFLVGSDTVPEHFTQLKFSASHIGDEDWNGNQSVFLRYPTINTTRFDPQTDVHNYGTWIPEIPASCAEDGVKGHYHCTHCGADFDENYVQLDSLTISALGHDFTKKTISTATLKSSADCEHAAEYYYSCTRCTAIGTDTFSNGEPLGHLGGTATCHTKAVCERCNLEYGEYNPQNHDGKTEIRNVKTETCEEPGNTGDLCCTGCDQIIEPGTVIPALGHLGGTATCHTKAVCERCKQEYGEYNLQNHDGETELRGQKDPTCEEAGYGGDLCCTGCGTVLQQGRSIDPVGHQYDPADAEKTAHHDADCTHAAYDCLICVNCGKESDEKTEYGEPLGHDYESVYTPPTATTNGYTTFTCQRCKDVTVVYDDPETTLKGMIGDINLDGDINAIDYILLKKYVLQTIQLNENQLAVADINGSGEIDAVDYILLKKKILNG